MSIKKQIQLNLAIPEHYRNLLRKLAAEKVLKDPGQIVSGASIATDILISALKEIEEREESR